jgi:hypothetical protein
MKSEGEISLPVSYDPQRPAYRSQFCVGGVSVQLIGDCEEDIGLVPPLEPFRAAPGASDLDIRVERLRCFAPPSGEQVFDSGTTWKLHASENEFQFDFNAAIFGDRPFKRLLIDSHFRHATLQMNNECILGLATHVEPLGYPLDELLIMHRLTQEQAIELHGVGMVGPDGASNLFVGHSGAGKSTTARLWTSLHKVEILSDDRIILREDASQIFMYGTPWHGEAHFALPQRAPLQRIFVLEHGHGNVITRLTPSQAVGELFARAFVPFHRHEYIENAITFLEHLVESVPCYRYSFEPDQRAVEKIIHFHD